MVSVLFAMFADRERADRARSLIGSAVGQPGHVGRLHEASVDPVLGMDLAGTTADGGKVVLSRFGMVFAAGLILGVILDVVFGFADRGLIFTQLGGGLSLIAGTVAVLLSPRSPFETGLGDVEAALDRGEVLVTVRVDETERDRVAAVLEQHGGSVVLEA